MTKGLLEFTKSAFERAKASFNDEEMSLSCQGRVFLVTGNYIHKMLRKNKTFIRVVFDRRKQWYWTSRGHRIRQSRWDRAYRLQV